MMPAVTERVLVVDDEIGIRDMLALTLRRYGYAVATADSAATALDQLQTAAYNLVLSDIQMPDSNGLELLARIKAIDSDLPVVIMTAFSSVDIAIEALNRGAFAYINKPFKTEELRSTVRNALDKYRIVRDNRKLLARLETSHHILQQVGLMIRSLTDLEQLLTVLLEQMLFISGAEVGAIILKEETGYSVRTTFGIPPTHLDLFQLPGGESLLDRLIADGRPGVVMRMPDGGYRFTPSGQEALDTFIAAAGVVAAAPGAQPVLRNPQIRAEVGNAVYIPFKTAERTVGLAMICNTSDRASETPAFIADLLLVTNYSALALERARLFTVALEKEKLDHELRLAQEIQRKLLPAALPAIPGYDIYAVCRPARLVGGDYFDFLPAGESGRSPALLITDVQGKGIPAALVMAQVAAAVRAYHEYLDSPAAIVARLNRFMSETHDDMLQPFLMAALDPGRRLRLVNAGHLHPLVRSGRDGRVRALERNNMILGLDPDAVYREQEIMLAAGDLVLFYTDGVTDLHSDGGAEFGRERLIDFMESRRPEHTAAEIGRELLATLTRFGQGVEQFDDITFILLRIA